VRYVVTGSAGFVGYQVCEALLERGHEVDGVDAFTDYYDPSLKRANAARLARHDGFRGLELDLARADLDEVLAGADAVIHLAAQPGVRLSWSEGFAAYVERNISASQRLLEAARRTRVPRLSRRRSHTTRRRRPAMSRPRTGPPIALVARSDGSRRCRWTTASSCRWSTSSAAGEVGLGRRTLGAYRLDQVGPRTGGVVPRARLGDWQRPGDVQVGIVVTHRAVFARVVLPVDPVADVGDVAQHLESVQQARRDVHVPELFIVEPKGLVTAEGGRPRAGVHHHIVDRAPGAAHELGFAPPGPHVEPTQRTEAGAGLRVLDERRRVDAVRSRQGGIKRAREETPMVAMGRGNEHEHVRQRCCPHLHPAILSAPAGADS
jgi:hypothetical protein